MKKSIGIGLLVVACVVVIATVFFPYSIFSVYKSVSFTSELPTLQKYKMELAELKNEFAQTEGSDSVALNTDYIINIYEMDLVTANTVKMNKRDLDKVLESVKGLRNMLFQIAFDEEHSSESNKYLKAALGRCIKTEEHIEWIKSKPYSTRFQLSTDLEELQNDFRQSFEMYMRFYDAYYNYEEDVD